MKKTKKLILSVMGMFLLFSVLVNSAYANNKREVHIPRKADVTSGKISVIKQKVHILTVLPYVMTQFSTSPVALLALKNNVKKTYSKNYIKIEDFDVGTYVAQKFVEKIIGKGMFQAELDDSFVSPARFAYSGTGLGITLNHEVNHSWDVEKAKNNLVLIVYVTRFLEGDKEKVNVVIPLAARLEYKPNPIDKSLKGKARREAIKAENKRTEKPIWSTALTLKSETVPAHRASKLYPVFMETLDRAIDQAVESLHEQPQD